MADGIAISPGVGVEVATDEVTGLTSGLPGSSQVQYVKIVSAAENSANKWIVDASGRGLVYVGRPSVGTRSAVAASVASVALLAANANRLDGSVYNDSTANLYLALGAAAASLTSFTVKVAPGGFYEIAYGFTGAINGIWDAAVGNARITELT